MITEYDFLFLNTGYIYAFLNGNL